MRCLSHWNNLAMALARGRCEMTTRKVARIKCWTPFITCVWMAECRLSLSFIGDRWFKPATKKKWQKGAHISNGRIDTQARKRKQKTRHTIICLNNSISLHQFVYSIQNDGHATPPLSQIRLNYQFFCSSLFDSSLAQITHAYLQIFQRIPATDSNTN